MAEDIASKIPNNLGVYLEVALGIIILLFIGFGLLKNWKFSLIQIVLFIITLVSVKAIGDSIYVHNEGLRNSVDQIAQKLATTIQNANSKIGSINSDAGTNLPTIDGNTVNSSFIGLAYTIIAAVASIGYALIALLISFLLALAIYLLVVKRFIKDNPKYQNVSKKFWYKAIGIVPNFVLSLMFGSLVISPIYISRNIAINTVKYPVNLGYTLPETFSEEIVKFAEYKVTLYYYLGTVGSYQEELESLEPSINEINAKITSADKQVSTVYDTFNGEYLDKANIVKANYKTKLTGEDVTKCETFINSYFEAKKEFDSDYKTYTGTKEEFNTTATQFNTTKNELDTYYKKIEELAASKIDLAKLISQFQELEQYETKIKNVLPDMKVFGWLVIDCGMYSVNIDGTKYYLQSSYNQLFDYIKDYVSDLITKFKEKSPELIKKYDEEAAKVDADVTKYQKELDEKIASFDSNEIISKIDSNLSQFEKYESSVKTTKENIDYWYNKVK